MHEVTREIKRDLRFIETVLEWRRFSTVFGREFNRNDSLHLALPVIKPDAFFLDSLQNPIYESFNDTSDDYYDYYTNYDYQYETSETDDIDESFTASYYEEENYTQPVSDSVILYDTSTVAPNFLSDSTTTEDFHSSASSFTSLQSETMLSTTTALDKIEGIFKFVYPYTNTILYG